MVKVNRIEDKLVEQVTIPTNIYNSALQSHLIRFKSDMTSVYFLAEDKLIYSDNYVDAKGWFLNQIPSEEDKKKLTKNNKVALTIPLSSVQYIQSLNYKAK